MFNCKSEFYRQKSETAVAVRMAGGDAFEATVYLLHGARLTDLLNDDRAFIPARRVDGEMLVLAKSQIISIVDMGAAQENSADGEDNDETEGSASKKFDPYAVLKLDHSATVNEIRAAYKSRIKAVHPDTIAALGLDEDLADAALKKTQKLNYAYRKIMRERGRTAREGAAA